MAQPLVSVLMSAYNAEAYVSAAVRSILEQSYRHLELLVTNDGSQDATGSILDSFARQDSRVHVIHQNNLGLTASLNKMVHLARGDFLARLDADDISYPDRLARQVDYLLSMPEVGVVSCWTHYIDSDSQITACYCHPDDQELLAYHIDIGPNPLIHSSIMMRKFTLSKIEGPFRFRFSQDLDLWLRLLPHTRFGVVESFLLAFRQHGEQMSGHNTQMRLDLAALIRELHARRQRGQEEGDWQSQQQKIIARFSNKVSDKTTTALSAYIKGRAVLKSRGPRRESLPLFLRAMAASPVRTKAFVWFILTLLPQIASERLSQPKKLNSAQQKYLVPVTALMSAKDHCAHQAFLEHIKAL